VFDGRASSSVAGISGHRVVSGARGVHAFIPADRLVAAGAVGEAADIGPACRQLVEDDAAVVDELGGRGAAGQLPQAPERVVGERQRLDQQISFTGSQLQTNPYRLPVCVLGRTKASPYHDRHR